MPVGRANSYDKPNNGRSDGPVYDASVSLTGKASFVSEPHRV